MDKETRIELLEIIVLLIIFLVGWLVDNFLSETGGATLFGIGVTYGAFLWIRDLILWGKKG